MGAKYSSQATSGYNSSAPPDDGTQVAANLISWSMVKTKLADVLKTFGEAINTALVSTLDLSARAISVNDTAIASDHWKTLQVTGATTITLSSAASMGAGYEVGIFNAGASTVTVAPGVPADTINNVSASITIPLKGTVIFRTNQALTGYNIVAQSNRADTLDGTVIGGTTPAAGTFTTVAATTTGKVATTLGVGNATPSASGSGVSFPATQSASTDVNTLDDYEEGTWTPSIGGNATYTVQTGSYVKIGRLVYIQANLTINVIGTGSTTVISGLPFANVLGRTPISASNTLSIATAVVSINPVVDLSASTISMYSRTAAATTEATNAFFQNSAQVAIAGFYFAAA